jgi:hypothetical protein
MLSKKIAERESKQGDLFRVMLRHPLVIFANSINWEVIDFEDKIIFVSKP